MPGSDDTRRGELSAAVRVRSTTTTVASSARSSAASAPPDLRVRPEGPKHVSVEVPEGRTTRAQKGTFEVTRVLPLDATCPEIFSGVGDPVVKWLRDGFNAVIVSYGQARSGKTTLLMGSGSPPHTNIRGCRPQGNLSTDNGSSAQEAERTDGSGEEDREQQTGGGLLRAILRGLFDSGAAATAFTAADAAHHDAADPFREDLVASTIAPHIDALNPMAGSWSPSRHTHDRSGFSVSPDGPNAPCGSLEANRDMDGAAATHGDSYGARRTRFSEQTRSGEDTVDKEMKTSPLEQSPGKGSTRGQADMGQTRDAGGFSRTVSRGCGAGPPPVVALSAWEVSEKSVTDLFISPLPDSGCGGTSSPAAGNIAAPGGKGGSSGSSNSSSNSIRSTPDNNDGGGKSRGAGRSRSRNRGKKGKVTGEGTRGDEAVGNGSSGSRRRRKSRGRSGSDDSSATGEGWPTGYPEDFLTIRALNLATALELVDTAQRRCSAGLSEAAEMSSEGGAGSKGKGNGGAKSGVSAAAAAGNAPVRGHVFFRVVVYNAVEETVSTLHVVDLAGGWEPPLDKPVGRRGSKGSGAGSARPSAASREWNSFDAMLAGLVPTPPQNGGEAAAIAGSADVPCKCSFCGADTSVEQNSEGRGRSSTSGGLGVDGCKGKGGGGDNRSTGSDAVPRPHPVFGAPKGKSFGGGGGGKLVEALQPLISGNTRTWLVVSVGGEGQGRPGVAWRALDVARRATGISTTCIRLRGVALADLRLRNAEEVLSGVANSSVPDSTNGSNAIARGAGSGVSDRRDGCVRPPASTTPVKPPTAFPRTPSSLGDTKRREGHLESGAPAPLGPSHKTFDSPGTGRATESPSSLGLSLSSLVDGENLLSLASTGFGEGVGEEERIGRNGGGEGMASTYLDDLAGFVRGGDSGDGGGGGGGDDRPRRISSDGLLGSDVTLDDGQEKVAAAWATIGETTAADTELEEKSDGGGSGTGPRRGMSGSKTTPASSVGNFLTGLDSKGQPQHRAPSRQGSSLRPGGRAAAVGSTPLPRTASGAGRREPRPSATGDGIGQICGIECYDDGDPTTQRSPVGTMSGRNDVVRRAAPDGCASVEGVARKAGGGGDVSSGASRARENIDRMMSSLLEEVLPEGRQGVASGTVLGSPGEGNGEGICSESPPVRASGPCLAAADSHIHTRAGCSSPNHPCSVATSSPPPATRNPDRSTSSGKGTPESRNSGGLFLTPIEVIMHAPAGDCGSTDRRVGSCRQCAASAETPTNGASSHPVQKSRQVTACSSSGRSQTPVLVEGRTRQASGRMINGRVSTSTARGNGAATDTSNGSGNGSGTANKSSAKSGGCAARTRPASSERGAHQTGASIGSAAEPEVEDRSKREAAPAVATSRRSCESEELDVSTTGEEAALLRRNHATLLWVIREQEDREKQIERRFEDKERDLLERVTTLEADLEGLRAEKVETRGRLRRAEVSSPSSEVFERYEAHAGLLEAENTSLRDQNIALEMRLLDVLQRSTTTARVGSTRRTTRAIQPREEKETEEQDGEYDDLLHQRTHETGPETEAEAPPSGHCRCDSGATSRYRVDGRVAPSGCGGRAAGSQPGGAAPMCAAVLKDLRRKLKEVELEANKMRAERAAVEKRDRLCQAQLRTLTEQRSKVRELFLREKEYEAKLVASRLESARAEVIAEKKAAEIELLRCDQASLAADREALVLELAEERRKGRRFEEDRRAYGHIRRFIERHAGGRPAQWDSIDSPTTHDEHEGPRFQGLERVASPGRERQPRQDARRRGQGFDTGGSIGAVWRGEESDDKILGVAAATRGGDGEEIGRFGEAIRPTERGRRRPASAPRADTRVGDGGASEHRCLGDSSGHLYSDAYRNRLRAGLGADLRTSVGGGTLSYGREDVGGGARRQRDNIDNASKITPGCGGNSGYGHHALNFSAGGGRPRTSADGARRNGQNGSLQAQNGPTVNDNHRNRRCVIASDDEWTDDACGNDASGIDHDESIPYCQDEFVTAAGKTARRVSATRNATRPPPLSGRRGVDLELEAERRLERRFAGAPATSRLSGTEAGSREASLVFGASKGRMSGAEVGLEESSGRMSADRRRGELATAPTLSSGIGGSTAGRHVGGGWLA